MPKDLSLDREAFRSLEKLAEEDVERRFRPYCAALHSFLNSSRVVGRLQEFRSKWAQPRDPEAFRNFKAEYNHWYTFNHGGRSEAQLNIGMWPNRLRVGLGFEFTEKEHGQPKEVAAAFTRFHHAVLENRADFDELVSRVPLDIEFAPGRASGLDLVKSETVSDFLKDLPRAPRWLFLGRFLKADSPLDAQILSDGSELASEIERVFGLLIPWWKKANR